MKTKMNASHLSRLSWACRRGMLELDVLLGNFLKEVYPVLSEEEKNLFEILLSFPDPQLFAWLLSQEKPADARLIFIIEKIRHHASTRI